ncbi:MAG: patatin family protein [Dehalococcoidales bacterium]|jgi:NTE family protein|nr:patatin family protein [Dehalococcoidales bacterium]|tara:strand:- start:217 stop:1044 length:828 start_codon:yes stop_codon:yes gene_type:complete
MSAKSRKKKVGLALSSGAARGWAHIGVLGVLEKEDIPIDMIAGTSAGALIGALYAGGKDADQLKKLTMAIDRKTVASLTDPTLPKTGFFEGKKIKDWMRSIIDKVEFRDLRMPFACVATDIQTGEEVVIKQGSVVEGVRASSSAPVIFSIVKWQGRYLVDGGLVNPVPVSVLKDMGADFIIAVNVVPSVSDRVNGGNKEPIEDFKEPNIFSIILRAICIAGYQAVQTSLNGADVVIKPQVAHIGFVDMHRARECIKQGELAAAASIREIKRQLGT